MKINKVYLQLVNNIKEADSDDKSEYLDMLKRKILNDIRNDTIVGNIKDPSVMGEFLEQIGMSDIDINHIVTSMKSGNEYIEPYHENDIILITGQSGIGKTHQAKKIHQLANPGTPFVTINAAILRPEFHGAELFGVEKGAYTGATEDKDGAFVAAKDGTLFIDELQSLSPEVQGMLNVALDERAVTKVGPSNIKVPYECKVILASNIGLEEMVESGEFRGDLYSRLTGPEAYHIDLSNLKTDKISEIVNQEAENLGIKVSQEAMALLQKIEYDYGIRELKTLIKQAYRAAKSEGSDTIEPEHLENEKIGVEKKAQEVQEHFTKYDPETMRYLAKNYTGDPSIFPPERIQRDRIIKVYEDLGGDAAKMSEWLQKGNLGLITKHLDDPNDLSSKAVSKALKGVMEEFAIVGDDLVSGMRRVSKILESTEDDPYTALLPEEQEPEEIDQRVLEAMDNTILMADEDILGIAKDL